MAVSPLHASGHLLPAHPQALAMAVGARGSRRGNGVEDEGGTLPGSGTAGGKGGERERGRGEQSWLISHPDCGCRRPWQPEWGWLRGRERDCIHRVPEFISATFRMNKMWREASATCHIHMFRNTVPSPSPFSSQPAEATRFVAFSLL